MDYLLSGPSNFINGYVGEVLVKVLSILPIDSLLRGAPKFVNGYIGEALVKGVINFINGFFAKRDSEIRQWVHG